MLRKVSFNALGVIAAIVVASMVAPSAFAGTLYLVSEYSSDWTGSSDWTNVNPCSSPWLYCYDGNVKWAYLNRSPQKESNWYAFQLPSGWAGNLQARAYIPNDGLSVTLAAVSYLTITWGSGKQIINTVVNQNNWQGTYVLMNSTTNGSANYLTRLNTTTYCVAGYSCDSNHRVYVDRAGFDAPYP